MSTTPHDDTARSSDGNPKMFDGLQEWKTLNGKLNKAALETAINHIKHYILENRPSAKVPGVSHTEAWSRASFLFSLEHSTRHLPNYATLDFEHIKKILDAKTRIEKYVKDKDRTRPINFMIVASPGEGKSHFVKCLADAPGLETTKMVSFNMATMRSADDLVGAALQSARNAKVEDKTPLLFLDEFDSDPHMSFNFLLPLLWDGEIALGGQLIKLGHAVVVLAGSDPKLSGLLAKSSGMKDDKVDSEFPKLVDLFSRINGGVIEFPPLRPEEGRDDRRVDKICIAASVLRARHKRLRWVPANLFRFIYDTTFRYGVRSITHLIDLLAVPPDSDDLTTPRDPSESKFKVIHDTDEKDGLLNTEGLSAILQSTEKIKESGLAHHLIHPNEAYGISESWDDSAAHLQHIVPVWCRSFDLDERPAKWTELNAGLKSANMIDELRGRKAPNLAGKATVAGIEPFALTRIWIEEREGQWNHGAQGMRHVFFSIKTLKQMLDTIKEGKTSIRDLGGKMGTSFGQEFVAYLKNDQSFEPNLNQLIYNWCRFDLSGGWGYWEHYPELLPPEIHVRNNFLADIGGQRFCDMMIGYIEGVLKEMLTELQLGAQHLTVKEVPHLSTGHKTCKFQYELAAAVSGLATKGPKSRTHSRQPAKVN